MVAPSTRYHRRATIAVEAILLTPLEASR